MELNGKFVERTRALFGEERYGRFVQALETEPVVSIRFNGRKMEADSSRQIYRSVPFSVSITWQ